MHIEMMTEEPSAEAALQLLVPKIIGTSITFAIHQYGDKATLLARIYPREVARLFEMVAGRLAYSRAGRSR